MNSDVFWKGLEEGLPPIFSRKEAGRLTGGLIAPGTLANLDSQGNGPEVRVRVGKHVGYERASFIRWLKSRNQTTALCHDTSSSHGKRYSAGSETHNATQAGGIHNLPPLQ